MRSTKAVGAFRFGPSSACWFSALLFASGCDGSGCAGNPGPAPEVAPAASTGAAGAALPVERYIVIDQFGYRPKDVKVAVLVDPVFGANQADAYSPGDRLEVRRVDDGRVVFAGKPRVWRHGTVDDSAGDRGAWFDFSPVEEPGAYFVVDPARGSRSVRFEVDEDVYRNVLRAALRTFYFNRANSAKQRPYACVAGKCWTLGADYLGPGQDGEARSVRARDDARTARDLRGGFWDAGDVNKYVTNAAEAVHQLLTAYREHPEPFTDDLGIPESANGLPDLLDEVGIELEWLEKMQPDDLDGGVLIKMGNVEHGDPLPDRSKLRRYYYPEPCSSATIAVAGVFAHAALVLRDFPRLGAGARELVRRAEAAWRHYHAHPKRADCDDGTLVGGDSDREIAVQEQLAVVAAVYLFAATSDARYDRYVAEHYETTRPFKEDRWSAYDPEQGDALLFYATLPAGDSAAKRAILKRKIEQSRSVEIYGFRPELDLYRAYVRPDSLHWGSNKPRANYGNTNYDMVQYELAGEPEAGSFRERAAGILHYLHGVNAMGLVYLSNMKAYGAERSVSEIFHTWFRDGDPTWDSAATSTLGPAPGYLVGGPNRHYCEGEEAQKHRCARSPLKRQPPEKAFLDFNTGYNPELEYDQSWELTEPAIYYQAAYVKLLSKFVD